MYLYVNIFYKYYINADHFENFVYKLIYILIEFYVYINTVYIMYI